MGNLLEVKNAAYSYSLAKNRIRAVDGVSLTLKDGGALGIVGESGSGKSTLGKMIAGLLTPVRGRIIFNGRQIEGRMLPSVQYVFQNSTAALNPRMRVAELVEEGLIIQRVYDRAVRKEKVNRVLKSVGLERRLLTRLPHQLSGGQKQRVALARTLILEPRLLILDEPVSSLDVTAGARLLALLAQLRKKHNISYILISHDLAVVKQICDTVNVMYAGKIVEVGKTDCVFANPRHYYTKMLLAAHPSPDPSRRVDAEIWGEANDPMSQPSGCRFHPRCPHAKNICRRLPPGFVDIKPGHRAACHFAKDNE